MKKSSVKEIARLANVSIGTVDRVLHNRGRVAKETEERIRKIVHELDYKPDVFARNLKLAKVWNFGVLMPRVDQDSRYWFLPREGIENAVAELSPLKIKVHYFFFDKYQPDSFRTGCRKALDSRLDGLIIAPVLGTEAERFINRIPVDLPYVFFDSFIPGGSPLAVIGQDSLRAGRLAASLMGLLVPGGGFLAVIRGLPRDYHIEQRVIGFLDYFRGRKNYHPEVYDIGNLENSGMAQGLMADITRRHPDLKGLFVSNANTHPFVHALGRFRKGEKTAVIGFDMVEENVRLLRTGKIDFLISQKPRTQGYQSVYSLYRHLILKEPVETERFMSLEIITRENIEESGTV